MPKKRKKKEEIVVPAPHFRPKREPLLKDTTGAEEVEVFKVSAKMGRGLSGLMIVVGALLSVLSVVSILISIESTFSNPFFVGAIGFLGAINILCGFMLLAKE